MRQDVLNCIHDSHLGIEKCKSRAIAVVYWPGMSTAIERLVAKCPVCLKYQRENQNEPLLSHEVPQRPWQKLGADILPNMVFQMRLLPTTCPSQARLFRNFASEWGFEIATSTLIDGPGVPVVAEPPVAIPPPDAATPSLNSSSHCSPQHTQRTSSGRTVRLPARFREDYVMN
ncbi:hypothetical protein ACROYT_G015130 [Oculina patagonica]